MMMSFPLMLAQEQGDAAAGAVGAVMMLVWLGVVILMIASTWVVFTKAGKPGWASIVPIYNIIVMLEIAGKPLWWILLLFIPLVNFIVAILIFMAIAKNFGKSELFGVGLALLGFIFMPLLAFGDAKYQGA
jgi:Family of unknown function (DUF5684)